MTEPVPQKDRRSGWIRTGAALLLALVITFTAWLLMEGPGDTGTNRTVSLTFLLVLPAVVCAIASFVTDPVGNRGGQHVMILPLQTLAVVLTFGLIFLREGIICIVMLSPLWLVGGVAGALAARAMKRRWQDNSRVFASSLLLLPMLTAQLEASTPAPIALQTVSREVIVNAPPGRVWPLLVSIPGIRPNEGRWNLTQSLLGVPRPSEARLRIVQGRAIRSAQWGADVRFEEHITRVEPGRALEWRFSFPDESVRERTDRHIAPDGEQLRIMRGNYRLTPTGDGRTRPRLNTHYAIRTHLNAYAALWGELFLGDIQNNVLTIVKHRSEARPIS